MKKVFTDQNYKDFTVTIFSQEGLKSLILMSLTSDSVFMVKSQKHSQVIYNAYNLLAPCLTVIHFHKYSMCAICSHATVRADWVALTFFFTSSTHSLSCHTKSTQTDATLHPGVLLCSGAKPYPDLE